MLFRTPKKGLVLDNAYEYIVPLFVLPVTAGGPSIESRRFLGTAFFVTSRGDAITAAHVIQLESVPGDRSVLVALVSVEGQLMYVEVTSAVAVGAFDMALLRVDIARVSTFRFRLSPCLPETTSS